GTTVACTAPCDAPEKCEPMGQRCVECLTNDDCREREYCDVEGGTFTCKSGCRDDAQCQALAEAMGVTVTAGCCERKCVNLDRDQMNCGTCSTACMGQNITEATCRGGKCGFGNCLPGFADCDGDPGNGCEHAVNTMEECGACNTPCAPAN